MKLALPKLERALRDRVHAEVGRSDALWQEYLRRHWPYRLRHVRKALYIALSALFLLGATVLMPAFLNMWCLGLGTFDPNIRDPAPIMHMRNEIGQALLTQAEFLTAIALCGACWLWTLRWKSSDIILPAYLPMSDAEYRAKVFKRAVWNYGVVIAWFAAFGYGYWGWFNNFTVRDWFVASALVLLQGVVVVALAAWLQGRFSQVVTGSGGAVFLVVFFTAFVDTTHPVVEDRTWIGMALMPAGWVSAAFKYGLVRRNPAGWLWILPAAALILLGWRRLQLPYAIREFVFHGRREVEAIPEERSAALKGPQFPLLTVPPKSEEPRLAAADAARRIRDAGVVSLDAGPRRGWLERWIRGRLSARERVILDCLFVPAWRFWSWTRWWNWIFLGTIASLALLAVPSLVGVFRGPDSPAALLYVPLYHACFLGPGVMTGRARNLPNNWLPIGDAEVCRLYWKVHLLATLLVSPFFAIVGAAVGWRVYDQPLSGLLVAAIWFYVILVLFPFRLILSIGTEAGDRGLVILRRMPLLFLLGCVGTCVVGAMIGALQWKDLRLTIVGVIALPLLSFGTWRLYRWSVSRWRGDLLPTR